MEIEIERSKASPLRLQSGLSGTREAWEDGWKARISRPPSILKVQPRFSRPTFRGFLYVYSAHLPETVWRNLDKKNSCQSISCTAFSARHKPVTIRWDHVKTSRHTLRKKLKALGNRCTTKLWVPNVVCVEKSMMQDDTHKKFWDSS